MFTFGNRLCVAHPSRRRFRGSYKDEVVMRGTIAESASANRFEEAAASI
jgi:hypothetical protein